MTNWKKIRVSLFFILISLLLVNRIHFALAYYPPEDCDSNLNCQCGYVCSGDNYCRPGVGNPCPTSIPVIPPTSVPQPPPGGVTPPPGVPTPTPPPAGGNTCHANCSGQVCGTVAGSYDCRSRGCGDGTCDTNDGYCKKCTTPGTSCCNYCVPEGWGCDNASCPWKISCRSYNLGNHTIGCGPNTIPGCSGGNECPNSPPPCTDPWCQIDHECGACFQDCPTVPTPTPIPVCSISNFTATKNNSCGATTVNLHWTVNSPIETSYVLAFYHNGSNWLQSGFSPANPLANTATNTTSPNFNPGNYNFQVCCNKNNINYGCSTQQPVAINTCPTPTPGVPGTPVVNVTPPICTNSNSTWAWSPVSNAVSYDIERHTVGTGTNWDWTSIQTTTSFTSSFNSGMATGGYGVRVAGINASGRYGNTSNWVNINRDISAPSTPVGLNLVCNTNGSVSASWSPATDVGCGGLHSGWAAGIISTS